jgi:hypothetical protein
LKPPYSSFEHLVLSICSNRGKGWRFAMVDAHTVYVDDSGTDGKSRVATAAFCVSTVEKWLAFGRRWNTIATNAGFKLQHFHMTEFAACRPDKPCRQCVSGETTLEHHPWRRWTPKKRKNVLQNLARAVVDHVECGFSVAHTKEDYEEAVRTSSTSAKEHFTHAVQRCGGELARWRAEKGLTDVPLKFVFDLASKKQRDEIAKIFFGAASGQPQFKDGIEQWFVPVGVSYESRKSVVQLLAADMLAWVVATIRARDLFRTGETIEMFQVADIFVETQIRMGHVSKESVMQWAKENLNDAKTA